MTQFTDVYMHHQAAIHKLFYANLMHIWNENLTIKLFIESPGPDELKYLLIMEITTTHCS